MIKPWDGLILALAAGLVGASYAACWTPAGDTAGSVRIRDGDGEVRILALGEDRQLEVSGRLGVSRVEISAGRVRFLDSPCAGRHCVVSGWLEAPGEVAVCLPNGVLVELIGSGEFDAVNF